MRSRKILLLAVLSFSLSISQQSGDTAVWLNDDWYFPDNESSFFDVTRFLPSFFRNEALLKRYIRDDRFYELRKWYDDTLAVDAIFDRAMLIAEEDVPQALFIAAFAVMDHRRVGLRVPIVGSVYLPLTSENDSLFRIRRTHLPKRLLNDRANAVDKDKLQHFFGSAYIAYCFNSDAVARCIGDLLETGEESFVLGGRIDERDKLANEKGREFGLRLLRDRRVLPSDVLWK